MTQAELETLLEESLQLISQGASLEESLEKIARQRPGSEVELRPLLEAAVWLQELRAPTVPASVQARSRTKMINKAISAQTGWRHSFPYRLLNFAALVGTVLLVLVLTTSLASARALPGDTLYPVKRAVEDTRLWMAPNEASRLEIEDDLNKNRQEEANELLQMGRTSQVEFSGFLTRSPDQYWEVDGIQLVLTPQMEAAMASLEGAYVEVEGISQAKQIQVYEIEVKPFQIKGAIQSIQGSQWQIEGINILVNPQVQNGFIYKTGQVVTIKATRLKDGTLSALQIAGQGSSTTSQSTATIEKEDGQSEHEESINPTQTLNSPIETIPQATSTPVIESPEQETPHQENTDSSEKKVTSDDKGSEDEHSEDHSEDHSSEDQPESPQNENHD
jgi:hypothetical protein